MLIYNGEDLQLKIYNNSYKKIQLISVQLTIEKELICMIDMYIKFNPVNLKKVKLLD
jgi:hypothetical protein